MLLLARAAFSDALIGTNYLPAEAERTAGNDFEDVIRYRVFCMVWATGTLFHMAQSRIYISALHYVLLTIAALALLVGTASVLRLVIFVALQLYEASMLQTISNHWLFATFVNLTIVQVLIYLIIRRQSFWINKAEFIKTLAPIVRVELLLLYFFVVLHKLNSGFFSLDNSCAALLLKEQHLDLLLPISENLIKLNIYLTIIIEALIPLLLLFRKTRNLGLLVGLAFHCVIAFNSFNGFYDFSSMVFGAYFLFTRYSFSNTIYIGYRKLVEYRARLKQRLVQFSFQNLVILLVLFLGGLVLLRVLTKVFNDYFQLIWAFYSFLFIFVFLLSLALAIERRQEPLHAFRISNAAFLLFPLVVFLNGMSPYLGLKTESSFAMFSNLRTEGGVTNHFFIPVGAQVFDYQKDMIEVVYSSEPQLHKVAEENKLITYFQFRNHIAITRPAQVIYVRNGQRRTFTLATASPDDELLQRSSPILRRLLRFRAISKTEPQPCQH